MGFNLGFKGLIGTGGSFVVVKQLWCKIDHSPPYSAEVKNEWSYNSTPPVSLNSFMEWTWRTLNF